MVVRSQKLVGNLFRADPFPLGQAAPELLGTRKCVEVSIFSRQGVVLDDLLPVRRIGELEAQDLGILFGLLEAVSRLLVGRLRLHHREREVAGVA